MEEKKEMKTHWRTIYKTDYLASWDVDAPYELTIKTAGKEKCKLSRGIEEKLVIRFNEKYLPNGVEAKPMIINPTNSKILETKLKSPYCEDFKGAIIKVYHKENKGRIGSERGLCIVDAFKKEIKKPILTKDHERFEGAKKAYKEGKFEQIKEHFELTKEIIEEFKK